MNCSRFSNPLMLTYFMQQLDGMVAVYDKLFPKLWQNFSLETITSRYKLSKQCNYNKSHYKLQPFSIGHCVVGFYWSLLNIPQVESHSSLSNSHSYRNHNMVVHTSLYLLNETPYPQFLDILHFLHNTVSCTVYQPIS